MFSSVYYSRHTNVIHCWEFDENGNKIHIKDRAPLYFYMKSDEDTGYKSIFGDKLKKVEFDTYGKFKESREMYKQAGRTLFESDVQTENRYIIDKWAGKPVKMPKLDTCFIDIEVHSEKGFPDPVNADWPITIITCYSTKAKRFYVFAEKDFDRNFKDKNGQQVLSESDYVYISKDEQDLLKKFVAFINKTHPDIISGWNSNGYDIPYIINRSTKILGKEITAKLSPINSIGSRKMKDKFGKEKVLHSISGINLIDYLDLYRKYVPGERSSFKLGDIAEDEIHETKNEYEGTLKDLYKDWQKYVEYNIQDVKLLIKLDNKLGFIDIMSNICYNCLVPLEQFSKVTKVLDGAFISNLFTEKIISPDAPDLTGTDGQYVGAFVKPPIPGVYDSIVSFDATSLYPSIMMMHNISPETKKYVIGERCSEIVQKILADEETTETEKSTIAILNKSCLDVANELKENKWSISSNGVVYDHNQQGVVSKFVKTWFDQRQYHKKEQFKCEKAGDEEGRKLHYGSQYNMKILINSVYGYVGSKFSRFYDRDNAIAVTLTGQSVIKTAMNSIDNYFNNKWHISETGKKLNVLPIKGDIVIYGDTDSAYLSAGKILESMRYKRKDPITTAEFVDTKICPMFVKIINTDEDFLTLKRMNCPSNKISFKREMVTERMTFLSKKHYAAWVLIGENGPVKPGSHHEIEVKGLEAVKSSTPMFVREKLLEFYSLYLKTVDKKIVDKFTVDTYNHLTALPVNVIARITSVNEINKNISLTGDPVVGATQQACCAIAYNKYIKQFGLEDKYEQIFEGDKIRIVNVKGCKKIPDYDKDSFGFKTLLPEEFGFIIDTDTIVKRVFIQPIEQFYLAKNWQLPSLDTENIEDLFG